MATVKKGNLTATGEWWRNLRWMKRSFWKGERQAGKREVLPEDSDAVRDDAEAQPETPEPKR